MTLTLPVPLAVPHAHGYETISESCTISTGHV